MAVPDPNRLGGLAWARRTRGQLTAAERRRLIGAIAVGQAANVVGRAKLALGRLPDGASSDRRARLRATRLAARAGGRGSLRGAARSARRPFLPDLDVGDGPGGRSTASRSIASCSTAPHWSTTGEPRSRFRARTSRSGEPSERWRAPGPRASIPPGPTSSPTASAATRRPARPSQRDGAIAYYVQYGAMVDGAGLRVVGRRAAQHRRGAATPSARARLQARPRATRLETRRAPSPEGASDCSGAAE